MPRTDHYDVVVVGAGLVGLATAFQLLDRYRDKRVVVLEKEDRVAAHQSGRNSGVIHSGIYYRPGSLKAENCREGRKTLIAFCRQHGIIHETCGKVIVAVTEAERPRLRDVYERGIANGVACEIIDVDHLKELEPAAVGVEALHVPEAGIVDFQGVALALASVIEQRGGRVVTGARVTGVTVSPTTVVAQTTAGEFTASYLINCAGLYADRVARMTGQEPGLQIVPFRGEYFELKPHARHLCRNLIYPVPDPAYPFLGVHFTRMFDGSVECGPSAILGFAREGYTLGTIKWGELGEIIRYRGFRALARRHWRKGILELRQATSRRYYLSTLQRLIPEITLDDIEPAPAGVRAQALLPDGSMADDFVIRESDRVVNVLNAASPAATASLNVGRLIAERLARRF